MLLDNLFYNGFNSKLIETAQYDGILEIPILSPPKEIVKPSIAVPFGQHHRITDYSSVILVFYVKDPLFRDFVSKPQNYVDKMKNIYIMSTPDCSVYRDMPFFEQLANIGVGRAIGYYWQEQGKLIYPNVRWGDERTYTRKYFDIPPAFAGIPKNSIVSIGTYGNSKDAEDKYYLEVGLDAMLEELTPKIVLVYGAYNKKIFEKHEKYTQFHHMPDWISYIHGKRGVK